MKKYIPIFLSLFACAAVFSSCVSMAGRYGGTQKIVSITQDDLKNKDSEKYAQDTGDTQTAAVSKSIIVKVMLEKNKMSITVNSDAPASADAPGISAARAFVFEPSADGNITVNGTSTAKSKLELTCPDGFLKNNNRTYRGNFIVYSSGGSLMLVNKVELEQYLYGVLPCEVSYSWEAEALKAQAVAARTFAIYNRLKNKNPEYDLDSGVLSQVYKGREVEAGSTNEAIEETAGEVMAYNGEVIQAFFHANSGGKTASSVEVWGGDFNYLQSVDDPYSAGSKGYQWTYRINRTKLSNVIAKYKSGLGTVYEMYIVDRTQSDRVKNIKLKGSEGEITIKGKDLRGWIGAEQMRSTNFSVSVSGDEFSFDGRGYGHGVGLPQEGAREMAKLGRTYKEILRYYYKNTKIKKVRVEE